MKKQHEVGKRLSGAAAFTLAIGLTGAGAALAGPNPHSFPSTPKVQTIATGLSSPRQLAFSPEGSLYVAEAGSGGPTEGARANCQKADTGGTVCFGLTGSITKITRDGKSSRVLTGLPSLGPSGDSSGPSDITFTGNHQFALVIGHGGDVGSRATLAQSDPQAALLGTVVTGDLMAKKSATALTKAFDVTGYEQRANPDHAQINSNGVGIARSGNGWVVVDAGANDVISTRKSGSTVGVLAPVMSSLGFATDAVPTDVVRGPDGAWYVSQLVGYPFDLGSSTIWRIVPGHAPEAFATGLSSVTSLAFSGRTLYAVQMGLLQDGPGTLVRVPAHSTAPVVVEGGLFAPYGLAISGANAYVTTGSVTPVGTVVKIGL